MKYKDTLAPLSESDYYEFIFNQYEPSIYESNELNDDRFFKGTYYSHVCRTRCFFVYREVVERLSVDSKIMDIGLFPGTIIRQLKMLLGEKVECYGAGQKIDMEFEKFIKAYVEKCVNTELDPFYLKEDQRAEIPIGDSLFDAVIATEVIEHLISPLELISEGSRILKPGGIFIITTPNVSHIGAVIKLLLGKSNYERLDRSPMYLQNDPWRGHIRFYDKNELFTLFERHGLKMVSHRYYQEKGWDQAKWPLSKRIVLKLTDMFAPIYREGHLAIFRKQ